MTTVSSETCLCTGLCNLVWDHYLYEFLEARPPYLPIGLKFFLICRTLILPSSLRKSG